MFKKKRKYKKKKQNLEVPGEFSKKQPDIIGKTIIRIKSYPEFIKDRFLNQEVHVVGSGPSLINFDYSKLKGKKVIAINHAYKLVEHDFCLFADKGFARRESPNVIKNSICVSRIDEQFPNHVVFIFAKHNFSMDANKGVWHRRSSGSMGICTALQGGASKVYIYGCDCRYLNSKEIIKASALNGVEGYKPKAEFYAHSTSYVEGFKHEMDSSTNEQAFKDTIQVFSRFPRNKILNMSKFSAIPYFEKSNNPYPT